MDCFVNLGQFRHSHQRKKKNAGSFRRDFWEDIRLLQSSERNARQTAWKPWLLAAPAPRRAGPGTSTARTSWTGSKRETCPAPPASIPASARCYPGMFLPGTYVASCPKGHPSLNKRRGEKKKRNIKTSCKCSYSTGWNRAFLSYQLFEEKQWRFPFH